MALDNLVLYLARGVTMDLDAFVDDPMPVSEVDSVRGSPRGLTIMPHALRSPNSFESPSSPRAGFAPQVTSSLQFMSRLLDGMVQSHPTGLHGLPDDIRVTSVRRLSRLREVQLLLLFKLGEVCASAFGGTACLLVFIAHVVELRDKRSIAVQSIQTASGMLFVVSSLCSACSAYMLRHFLSPSDGGTPSTSIAFISKLLACFSALVFAVASGLELLPSANLFTAACTLQAVGAVGIWAAAAIDVVGVYDLSRERRDTLFAKATAEGPYEWNNFMSRWLTSTGLLFVAMGMASRASSGTCNGTGFSNIVCALGAGTAGLASWWTSGSSADYIQLPVPEAAVPES